MFSSRTILPIKVEADPTGTITTAHAGLLAYLEPLVCHRDAPTY